MSNGLQGRQVELGDDDELWNDVVRDSRAVEWEYLYGTPAAARAFVLRSADVSASSKTLMRASRYLATTRPSVEGENGSGMLFRAASALTRGFCLSEAEAMPILEADFNARCVPPWTRHELARVLRRATRTGRMALGSLRDAPKAGAPTRALSGTVRVST